MKVLSIIRMLIITLLASACILLICCEVDESASLPYFFKMFFFSKSMGFLAGYLLYRCFKAWQHTDYYLSRLIKWCDESEC